MRTYEQMQVNFERAHNDCYGFIIPGKYLIIEAIAVEGIGVTDGGVSETPQKTAHNEHHPPFSYLNDENVQSR